MEKEFVPYTEALALKELGFDEPCVIIYYNDGKNYVISETLMTNNELSTHDEITSPLYQQAFRWFRDKYNAVYEIIRKEDGNHSEFIGWVYINNRKIDVVSYWDSKTYEEAELACLEKLIEIVEQKEK